MYIAKKKPLDGYFLFPYIVFVCAADGLYDFLIGPHVQHALNSNPLMVFVEPVYKLFFWILPTFFYLKYIKNVNPLTYLKLTTNVRRGVAWGLLASLIFVLGFFYKHVFQGIPFHLSLSLDDWINVVLLVGFLEEIPFRGLIFQNLQEYLGFWWGMILSSLVFLELHLVYWLTLGKSLSYLAFTGLYIFLFACIMCFFLRLSRSLWSCIIIHSLNDLASLL